MIKDCIITPTYSGHFRFIEKYLKSMITYVEDKDIPIFFTISASEKNDFDKVISQFREVLNIHVLVFEDVLAHFGITISPEALLKTYGKFSFQTLKKFYSMLYVDANRYLVLDSESMWIRQTNMGQLFDDFFSNPYVAVSTINAREPLGNTKEMATENTDYLLGFKSGIWTIENFMWFYKREILEDMFAELGPPMDIINKVHKKIMPIGIENGVGVFEVCLYQSYICKSASKYGYSILNVTDGLKGVLGDDLFNEYVCEKTNLYKGDCGLVENAPSCVTQNTIKPIALFFKTHRFQIIRCYRSFRKLRLQREFIAIAKPNILASDQEHFFGLNNNISSIIGSFGKAVFSKLYLAFHHSQKNERHRDGKNGH